MVFAHFAIKRQSLYANQSGPSTSSLRGLKPCPWHENKQHAQAHRHSHEHQSSHRRSGEQEPAHEGFFDPRPVHPGVFTKSQVCSDDVEFVLVRDQEVRPDREGKDDLKAQLARANKQSRALMVRGNRRTQQRVDLDLSLRII